MGLDLNNIDLQINVEIVDGGFIVSAPQVMVVDGMETGFRFKRTVVTSPRKALNLVKDALNEFKRSDANEE